MFRSLLYMILGPTQRNDQIYVEWKNKSKDHEFTTNEKIKVKTLKTIKTFAAEFRIVPLIKDLASIHVLHFNKACCKSDFFFV